MTLCLRCIRCGDLDDMDPLSFNPGVCGACVEHYIRLRERGASHRRAEALASRYEKNIASHPTHKALTAALNALESTPTGELVPGDEDIIGLL